MPRLPQAVAEKAQNSESRDFSAFEPGIYTVKLVEVDTSGSGNAGSYWTWKWEVQDEGPAKGRWLWDRTSLSENAAWKLKQLIITGMQFEITSDTDEMVGESCRVEVSRAPQEQGKNAGKMVNQIETYLPLSAADEAPATVGASAGGGSAESDPWS